MDYKLKYFKYKKKYLNLKNNKLKGGKTETIKNKNIKKGNKLFNLKKKELNIKKKKLSLIDKVFLKATEYKFKCVSGNCKDGYGTLKSNRGNYVGEIKNNLPNGKGKYTANDGIIIESEWKNGKQNGPTIVLKKITYIIPNHEDTGSIVTFETSGVMIDGKWDGLVQVQIVEHKDKPNKDISEYFYKDGIKSDEGKIVEYKNNKIFSTTIKKRNYIKIIKENGDIIEANYY